MNATAVDAGLVVLVQQLPNSTRTDFVTQMVAVPAVAMVRDIHPNWRILKMG